MIQELIAADNWDKARELSQDKVFYIIHVMPPGNGMFSNVAHVLEQAVVAEKLSLLPIVDMYKFKTLYNEDFTFNNFKTLYKEDFTLNAYEYYFNQLCDYSLDHAYNSQLILGNPKPNCKLMYPPLDVAIERYKKYFKPKEYILRIVESFRKDHFDSKKVLGIHWRGGDMKTAPRHHTPPSEHDIINATYNILNNQHVDKIFVATEQQRYLDILKKRFGSMLLYTDYYRTYENINAYWVTPQPRKFHMYKLGLEIIIDALLLSHVDYLIAGGVDGVANGSNVSLTAQILNGGKYKQVVTIYNGLNA